jgi:methionyl-tRNA formyltransferase
MRVGFITCVQLGLSCMEAIYEAGGGLVFAGSLLDSQAAAKSGRVYLDQFCNRHGVPLVKFRNVNDADAVAAIRAAALDWLVIIGWSQIARDEVLAASRHGVLGIHPTLLPLGRGRAAIPWAILLGLESTGVTMFKLDGGVDTGPIVAQVRVSVGARETATSLYERINAAHRTLILKNWADVMAGGLRLTAQDSSLATTWPGRTPEQGRLTESMSVVEADRLVRAVTRPYPGAFIDRDGRRMRIWSAEPVAGRGMESADGPPIVFADGVLRVTEMQWESIENSPA